MSIIKRRNNERRIFEMQCLNMDWYEEMSFYLGFVYIHLYPRFCHFGRVMRVRLANEPLLCCTAHT